MPAILVEAAFIDTPEDARLLTDYPDLFARAIACGVTDLSVATGRWHVMPPDWRDLSRTRGKGTGTLRPGVRQFYIYCLSGVLGLSIIKRV